MKVAEDVFAGFDLGGTNLKFGLIGEDGRSLIRDSAPIPRNLAGCLRLIEESWRTLKVRSPKPIAACGFGFAGFFSRRERKILASPNYPPLEGFDLVPALAAFVDVPFAVDNDANLAAFGEYTLGAGRGAHSLVLLTFGTGVGSGIVLRGDIWRGVSGYGGEFGHITVNPAGRPCRCGNIGCLESETGAPAIVRNFHALSGTEEDLSAEEIHGLALAGSDPARRAFARAAGFLGIGLGIIINALNPEKILLGGGVMAAADVLLEPAVREAARWSHPVSYAACRIERAALGNDAGFMGAAAWAGKELARA